MFDWASEDIEIFKKELSWSKLSRLLQRIAFSCFMLEIEAATRGQSLRQKTPVLEALFE